MFAVQVATTKGQGGIVTAVKHYARMFSMCGVENAALYRGPALGQLRDCAIETVEAPPWLSSPLGPMAARISGVVPHWDPDLVVVHSDLCLTSVRALWPRAAVVTPCHSDKAKRKRHADVVITLNPTQHSLVAKALDGAHARPVLLGNPYVSVGSDQTAEQAPAPRLVFCGRFIETKDPALLIQAAAGLPSPPPLCFIGEGPLEPTLRAAAAASGLNATFTGWLRAPFNTITRSDILVLPSSWEGLPYMVQEALDHGVSVAAADNPGNRYALADGAFGALFKAGDANDLAQTVANLLDDPQEALRRADAGRLALTKRFGPQAFFAALSRAVLDPTVGLDAQLA